MIREVRKIKSHNKKVVLYRLLALNKIPRHINDKGYLCYDEDELKEYKKTARRGRPPKRSKEN